MRKKITLATRGSKLALAQAFWVEKKLKEAWSDFECEILKIKTTGDQIQDQPLRDLGGKSLFVKEIEQALLENRADIAVHSMKDVPAELPNGLEISVMLERENPCDVLISTRGEKLSNLPAHSVIGTASLRRQVHVKRIRSDFKLVDLRGNVDTRIEKVKKGEVDAIILALAGLNRLNLQHHVSEVLDFIPSPGQGAVGVECRSDDVEIKKLLQPLQHPLTYACVNAERVILKSLEGNCRTPLGAYGRVVHNQFDLKAFVSHPNGSNWIESSVSGDLNGAINLAHQLVEEMIKKGAKKLF